MKRDGNNITSEEFEIKMKTSIFEKKPNRGGTPASESIISINIFV